MSSRMRLRQAQFALCIISANAALGGSGGDFDLSWFTIDTGGVSFSTDGTYELGATIGQPDAHDALDDGEFQLTGGFWAIFFTCPSPDFPADMNCDGRVSVADIAGFVLALTDPPGYALAYPDCFAENGDINLSCAVTVEDIAAFVQAIVGGG